MTDHTTCFALDAAERESLARDGFVLREGVFSPEECAEIAGSCETLLDNLVAAKRGQKTTDEASAALKDAAVFIKWEPEAPDVLLGIEPFAHLNEPLAQLGLDPRLVDPAKALVGADELVLFTEKLNVKRANRGGPIVLHQDYPYWEHVTPIAHQVATAMIFLDEASRENGCLEVAAGSHTAGRLPGRKVGDTVSKEMDPDAFDEARLQPLEVAAGSVVFFGPFLVHRSRPNLSDHHRRALLYSYQPKGHPHGRELHKSLLKPRQSGGSRVPV